MTTMSVRLRITSAVLLLTACSVTSTTDLTTDPTITMPPTTTAVSESTTTTIDPDTTTTPATDVTLPGEDPSSVVAVWPAANVVIDDPRDAASQFVVDVLNVPPVLGPFMAGDGRSGEITLFSPGSEESDRGIILVRRLGENDGWFVIGVANDVSYVSSPLPGAVVPAAPLTVTGVGHGFEASISVTAFLAGDPSTVFDSVVTQAGSMETPGRFVVELDLSTADVGDVVAIVVRGGVGLETDPGETGAVAVVIG